MKVNSIGVLAAGFVAIAACESSPISTVGPTAGTLYHGFSRIDLDNEEVVEDAWLVVTGEKISAMGVGNAPSGDFAETRDMSGLFAMPGLIDGHAHITAGPHKIEFKDGAPAITIESRDEITQFHGKIALAFGVTTVRNPGGDTDANARYDMKIANQIWDGPEALHAGSVIQPPPFVGSAFSYPETDEEWQLEAKRQADLGMTYFKLYLSLTEDELLSGIKAAHDHGLKATAHLDKVSWTRAVELGIDGLEHALPTSPDLLEPAQRDEYIAKLGPDSKYTYRWFEHADYDGPLFQEMVSLLSKNNIETNLTLVVNELTYNVDKLDEVWPIEERQFVYPENLNASLQFLAVGATGWTEKDYEDARAAMPKVLEFAKRLHEAGVPMMLGTDGFGGGPFYARELELHAAAGISTWDILRMATSESAEILGVSERTGHLARDMEADIVFLTADPSKDVANVQNVAFVLSNGREFSYDALIDAALSSLDIAP